MVKKTLPFYTCKPRSRLSLAPLADLWHYRNLLWVFVKRDLKVRYRYTMLGGLWSIIQPLSMMLIFSLVFSHIFHVQTAGVPYPIFSYAALIIWQSVSRMLTQGGTSLNDYGPMLSKVYFPRMLVPLAIILGACVDFVIASTILLGMIVFYGISLSLTILWVPLILLGIFCLTMGLTLWVSALDVQFRDIRAALPFLLQVWMFATPLMYPVTIIPQRLHTLYYLNPLVTYVELFRWALLGGQIPTLPHIFTATFLSIVFLISGLLFFNKIEGTIVDRI
ncbi:ABC transporter permease [Candidatus Finniella inopinata]|uniref:Transport permease protein n=1 Tax=Candidatus Finniella inopinata TaxID=1696036 RepID=A0A4Q7DIT9_9PROT|nr:ABC transporter permease [Candidatus Finniella inopinata]RZI46743.1 ABC transporter permease [Candidatus Finniella inopinata]